MTDPVAYALACAALLAAPGPTNALLAMSAASAGAFRSAPLILAVAVGYLLSILFVGLVLAPVVEASALLDIAMRIGCGAYLGWAAWKMWTEGADPARSNEPVKASRLFVATLLNPKGLVAALALIPHLRDGQLVDAAPWLAAFLAIAALVSALWIAVGAALKSSAGARVGSGAVRRTGAGVLALFAVLMAGSAAAAGVG